MSTGLMSCVRDTSPSLSPVGTESPCGATNYKSSENDTHKRRRFHPLRNLRRIFRRRTVSHAEAATEPIIHNSFGTTSSSNTATTVSSSRSNYSMPIQGGYLYLKRDHPSDGYDSRVQSLLLADESDDLDHHEIAGYQRSLSEGRLIDNDLNQDHFSQSHDSVFSESANASSLSSVLKVELSNALKKRGLRPETSEEDLGLPQSPITPNSKIKQINHNNSQGSLSALSLISSDMDDDQSPNRLNSSNDSSRFLSRPDSSSGFDEVNLELSSSYRLSNSAARHKLAVRPKKKGPSNPRLSCEQTNTLPSTPEVNEVPQEVPEKVKSQSLPRESDPVLMKPFEKRSDIMSKSSETSISYIKSNTSKPAVAGTIATTAASVTIGGKSVTQIKPDENIGLIKRFWNRYHDNNRNDSSDEEVVDSNQKKEPEESILNVRHQKSSVATRQRIAPKDVDVPSEKDLTPETSWQKVLKVKDKGSLLGPTSVTKSKSFRTYTPNNLMSTTLPSLPNLTQGDLESPSPFSSIVSDGGSSDINKIKFEINDYNLLNRKQHSEMHHTKRKNLVLKGVEELKGPISMSQIEENIDKLMKSNMKTVLKNNNSVDCENSPSTSPETATPTSPKPTQMEDIVFREKHVSSVLEQFESRTSIKQRSSMIEVKPPIPVVTTKVTILKEKTTEGSLLRQNSRSEEDSNEAKIDRSSNLSGRDDRKVILQRRTSVSQERLKYERRVSAGDELRFERKKSQSEDDMEVLKGVTLRKRSMETSNDDTPELMKVFARRSTRFKDDENMEKIHDQQQNLIDSDKENLSNSEETLDKFSNMTNNNVGKTLGSRETKDKENNVVGKIRTEHGGEKKTQNGNEAITVRQVFAESVTEDVDIEFKGILQRKAEWEKRAKEGFK